MAQDDARSSQCVHCRFLVKLNHPRYTGGGELVTAHLSPEVLHEGYLVPWDHRSNKPDGEHHEVGDLLSRKAEVQRIEMHGQRHVSWRQRGKWKTWVERAWV